MKFIADKSYWELFPNSKLGILLLKNMENGESTDEIKYARTLATLALVGC